MHAVPASSGRHSRIPLSVSCVTWRPPKNDVPSCIKRCHFPKLIFPRNRSLLRWCASPCPLIKWSSTSNSAPPTEESWTKVFPCRPSSSSFANLLNKHGTYTFILQPSCNSTAVRVARLALTNNPLRLLHFSKQTLLTASKRLCKRAKILGECCLSLGGVGRSVVLVVIRCLVRRCCGSWCFDDGRHHPPVAKRSARITVCPLSIVRK